MITALVGFAAAATLVILAPGPDSMLVMRNSLRGGRRAGMCTAAGTLTGLLSWAVAATLGLSSLLAASRTGYDVLRLAGASYLIWLGVHSLRPRRRTGASAKHSPEDGREAASGLAASASAASAPAASVPQVGLGRAYLNGVISNLCNPKIGVFFVAFLPGFIPAGVSVREFSFLLGIWFVLETGLWLTALVSMAVRGMSWLRRPAVQRRLERLTGLVLIGFGIRLATESR